VLVDCLGVTKRLLEDGAGLGLAPARIAVAGDSAGDNMAAVAAQTLPGIAHQALVFAVLDLAGISLFTHDAVWRAENTLVCPWTRCRESAGVRRASGSAAGVQRLALRDPAVHFFLCRRPRQGSGLGALALLD
jgi:acetyl esterase/lipase